MDKRYLVALSLTILILIVYPHYLEWIGVAPKQGPPQKPPLRDEKPFVVPAEIKKPIPTQTFPYQNELYKILFTPQGGNILFLKHGDTVLYEARPGESGIFGITVQHEGEDLREAIFETEPSEKKGLACSFFYEKPSQYRLTKRYFVASEKPTLVLEVELENLSERERNFSLGLDYALVLGHGGGREEMAAKAVRFTGEEFHETSLKKIQKGPFLGGGPSAWHGLLRKYDAILVKPDLKIVSERIHFDEDRFVAGLGLDPLSVGPREKNLARFLIYAGPQRYETLRELGFGFEKILTSGMLGVLRTALLVTLHFFYRLVGNYGAAILLITLLIKLVFTPLTHWSYQSMGKMQALQPKMKALQQQYKNDPSRLQKEMMELYRRNRVNPMMGCLPLFLQIPIFIAFYQVLSESVELKGAGFGGWIRDLSEPDRLFTWPVSLPFLGNSFNLLPLLMIGSMVWQQKLTPQTAPTPQQEKVTQFLPIIFGLMFYNLPSGLVLYWFASNLLTIFHQLVIKRIPVILHHEDRE